MYTINANFQRFKDVHLGDMFGAAGVYVLWDSQSQVRPTYIGEGNILKRFSDHWMREDITLAQPLDGYVAIIGDHGHGPSKNDGCILEYLLLDVATTTNRKPSINSHPGLRKILRLMCDTHRTVRVAVRGFDPLIPPWEARPLSQTKQIKAWITPDEELFIESGWCFRASRKN